MNFANGETVVVLTAGTKTDPYGEEVEDWSLPPVEASVAAGVEPRPAGEPVRDPRNAVVSGYTLYFGPEVTIGGRNRVQVRGSTYAVIGDPAVWVNPFTGWEPGQVVQVERPVG